MPEREEEPVRLDEAGTGDLDDEMLPDRGEPVPQEEAPGGDVPDPGAERGAVETARSLDRAVEEQRK